VQPLPERTMQVLRAVLAARSSYFKVRTPVLGLIPQNVKSLNV
jgi:hypothetical protein